MQLIKVLLAEHEAFQSIDKIPTHPELTEDVIRYIGQRRKSASETHAAYMAVIKSYMDLAMTADARLIQLELKKFTDSELAAISINAIPPNAPANNATAEPGANVPKPKSTKDNLTEFFKQYTAMLDSIASEPTTVKKEEVHRNISKKIDENLKLQTWEFRCSIKNIQERSGKFLVSHESPEEMPDPEQRWSVRNYATLSLSRQQALDLKPGDVIIYTGTPRFTNSESDSSDTAYFSRDFHVGNFYGDHVLHLTSMKYKIENAKK